MQKAIGQLRDKFRKGRLELFRRVHWTAPSGLCWRRMRLSSTRSSETSTSSRVSPRAACRSVPGIPVWRSWRPGGMEEGSSIPAPISTSHSFLLKKKIPGWRRWFTLPSSWSWTSSCLERCPRRILVPAGCGSIGVGRRHQDGAAGSPLICGEARLAEELKLRIRDVLSPLDHHAGSIRCR